MDIKASSGDGAWQPHRIPGLIPTKEEKICYYCMRDVEMEKQFHSPYPQTEPQRGLSKSQQTVRIRMSFGGVTTDVIYPVCEKHRKRFDDDYRRAKLAKKR